VKVEHENNDELSRVSTMTSQKSTSGMASSAFGNDRSPPFNIIFALVVGFR
jgi:hypothetical protein